MNIDRNGIKDQDVNSNKASSSEEKNDKDKTSKEPHFTEVKNAHATGLGSMGRSDEKLTDKEKRAGEDDVVY